MDLTWRFWCTRAYELNRNLPKSCKSGMYLKSYQGSGNKGIVEGLSIPQITVDGLHPALPIRRNIPKIPIV